MLNLYRVIFFQNKYFVKLNSIYFIESIFNTMDQTEKTPKQV